MADDDSLERAPSIGTVLEGRYRLIEQIGEGGVGWVYRARHLKLGTEVAIKMLQAPYEAHELLRPRFEREAKALAQMRHPNIVTLTDYSVTEDGRPYIAMELLEGQTLGDLIDDIGPIPERRARHIMSQILDALIYAHGENFVHRDLKPNNVFLVELPTEPDHVKILDFGFVKLLGKHHDGRSTLTKSGIAFGTPRYMSPEQATGAKTDPRADVYSAGVVYFEMLAGAPPYSGEVPEVVRAHLTKPIPPLDVGGDPLEASAELRELIELAMAKDPGERYQSATELKEALDALPFPSVTRRAADPSAIKSARRPLAELDLPTLPSVRTGLDDDSVEIEGAGRRGAWRWMAAVAVLLLGVGVAAGAWLGGVISPEEVSSLVGGEPADPDLPEIPDVGADGEPAESGNEASAPESESDATEPVEAGEAEGTEPSETGEGEPTDLDLTPEDGELVEDPGEDPTPAVPELDPALDPWNTLEPDRTLSAARALLERGRGLPPRHYRRLRRYVRSHRDDPRSHLVLARHFMANGLHEGAIERYELAFAVNEASRHDAQMLSDVVEMVGDPYIGERAGLLVRRVWGTEAIPAISRRLADPGLFEDEATRLRALRSTL